MKKSANEKPRQIPEGRASQSDERARAGRPTLFSDEIAERICSMISEGTSLVQICLLPDLPSRRTVLNWISDNRDFCTRISHARERQAEHFADEIVAIADTCSDPRKAKLQIDARKWYASKVAPRKYGDKLDITSQGGTREVTREDMIEKMRKSPAFLAEIEAMVAEARTPT